jgi:hypothetical protein
VLVWGFTKNGRKWNFVGLGIYSKWKKIKLCCFGDV